MPSNKLLIDMCVAVMLVNLTNFVPPEMKKDNKPYQGSYRQVSVKFKDFSRTSKRLFYRFKGLKTDEKY